MLHNGMYLDGTFWHGCTVTAASDPLAVCPVLHSGEESHSTLAFPDAETDSQLAFRRHHVPIV